MLSAGLWRKAARPDGEAWPCVFSTVPQPPVKASSVLSLVYTRETRVLQGSRLTSDTFRSQNTRPESLVLTALPELTFTSQRPLYQGTGLPSPIPASPEWCLRAQECDPTLSSASHRSAWEVLRNQGPLQSSSC